MQDEQRIANGIDARRPSGDEVVALMRAFSARVADSRRAGSVSPLMEFVYANMAKGAALLSDVPVACGSGCSHCCHSPWVDARPPEVIFAVKSMTSQQRRRAAESVRRIGERTRGKSLEMRSGMVTPCPLLENHKCSLYDARPVVCRSLVSTNAEACRRAYLELSGESFSSPDMWRTLGAAYFVALEGAVMHARLVAIPRALGDSLELALADPGAEAKWLAGEDVFRDAPRASLASNFESRSWAYLYRQAFGEPVPARA